MVILHSYLVGYLQCLRLSQKKMGNVVVVVVGGGRRGENLGRYIALVKQTLKAAKA